MELTAPRHISSVRIGENLYFEYEKALGRMASLIALSALSRLKRKAAQRAFYPRDTSTGVYSYSRTRRGKGLGDRSSSLAEDKANGKAQRVLIAAWRQKPGSWVAGKDDDIGGVLVGHQQPLIAGIEGEMARALASTVHMLDRFECSLAIVDGEDRHAVIPAVGGIDKPALGIDRDRSRGVRSGEAFGEGRDVLDSAQGPLLSVPCQDVECAGNLVEGVRPPSAGMKSKTSWTGAGQRLIGGGVFGVRRAVSGSRW